MDKRDLFKLTLLFTFIYVVIFSILSLRSENYEFLYYSILILISFIIIFIYHKRMYLSEFTIAGLSLVGFIDLLAGNLYINGVRLFHIRFINDLIKFDNIVHFLVIFVVTFAAYDIIKPYLRRRLKKSLWLFLMLILVAMGVGAFIEVFEFVGVLLLPSNDVGDYFNNALDLVFNLIGSIAACLVIWFRR